MGMSIEDAINGIEKRILPIYDNDADHKALVMAIDTMRKYQKIVDIVSLNDEEFKQCGLKELKVILEVIADGNDD
jgi:myosin-crossreactive antigen